MKEVKAITLHDSKRHHFIVSQVNRILWGGLVHNLRGWARRTWVSLGRETPFSSFSCYTGEDLKGEMASDSLIFKRTKSFVFSWISKTVNYR